LKTFETTVKIAEFSFLKANIEKKNFQMILDLKIDTQIKKLLEFKYFAAIK
jgi:hypothetical protein